MNTTFDYGFIRCLYGFTAGTVAFRIYDLYVRKSRAPINRVTATLAEATSLAIVVVFVLIADEMTISVIAPYVFLITVVAFSVERGLISYVMTYRPLAALGTLSYSIYMVHLFVQCQLFDIGEAIERWSCVHLLTYVDTEHKRLLGTELWYGDLLHLVMLPVVIAASYMTYRFIEEPSRDWFRTVSASLFGTRDGSEPSKSPRTLGGTTARSGASGLTCYRSAGRVSGMASQTSAKPASPAKASAANAAGSP
jgi:peptidoglycan/LPS O-acetylase OafA/YrhL